MKPKNVYEELVMWYLPNILPSLHCCTCNYCRSYLVAGTLNRLHPRYVVTHKEYLLEKSNVLNPQFNVDILTAILLTANELQHHPMHPIFLYRSE